MENVLSEEVFNEESLLTAEEVAARKQEMLDFYREQVEFLTVQVEFEKLTAEVEEQRLRRLVAMVRQAQIQSPPEQPEMEQDEQPQEKKRTLKKS